MFLAKIENSASKKGLSPGVLISKNPIWADTVYYHNEGKKEQLQWMHANNNRGFCWKNTFQTKKRGYYLRAVIIWKKCS